jgi:hypothetical protein
MDDGSMLARLARIGLLDRSGAPPGELLAELRDILCEAEQSARECETGSDAKEVVERLGTAPHGT